MTSKTAAIMAMLLVLSVSFAAPTGLSIAIESGNAYTDSTSVTVSLNATGADTCQLSNDDSVYTNISGSPPTDESWTLESGDGEKTVHFRCVDGVGNWSGTEFDTITLDTTSPTAATFTPSDGGSTADTTPAISARLSDTTSGIDESTLVMTVDGSDVSSSTLFTSVTGLFSYTPTTSMAIGSHNVTIEFSDNAGNDATDSWEFTVDPGPVLDDDYTPGDGAYITEGRPTISITVDDEGTGINTSRTEFELDGDDVSEDVTYTASTGLLSYRPSSSLDDGNYTVEVRVYDTGGMSDFAEWEFMLDRTDPEFSLPVPSDLSAVSMVSEIAVRLSDDGSGINESSIEMYVDAVDVTDGTDYNDHTGRLVFPHVAGMSGGMHNVDVTVSDRAGNSETFYWSFTLDAGAPTISSMNPADGSKTSDVRPTISAVLADSGPGLDLETIRIYVDSSEVTSDSTFDVPSGKLAYQPADDLDAGSHTARVKVANLNGNDVEESWRFTVDITLPSRATSLMVTLEDDETVLNWKASTSADVEGYKIYRSSSKFDSIIGMSPLDTLDADARTYTTSGTSRYYYAVVAYDEAGNHAQPAFGTNCGSYDDGEWDDYECCWDTECPSSASCELETNTCTGTGEATDTEVAPSDASDAIDEAEADILSAAASGKDVSDAAVLLDQARSAYNVGNYEQAYELATRAIDAAASAPQEEAPEGEESPADGKEPPPCCPGFILFPALFVSSFLLRRV